MSKINILFNKESQTLEASFNLSKTDLNKYYAFYLYKDNIKINEKWYSRNNKVSFKVKENALYKIKGFIKDNNKKVSFLSKSINVILSSYSTNNNLKPLQSLLINNYIATLREDIVKNDTLSISYININGFQRLYNLKKINIGQNLFKKYEHKDYYITSWNIDLTIPIHQKVLIELISNYEIEIEIFRVLKNDIVESYIINQDFLKTYIFRSEENIVSKYILLLSKDKDIKINDNIIATIQLSQKNLIQFIKLNKDYISKSNLSQLKYYEAAIQKKTKTPFFLTLDIESFYFKRPSMINGEGLKNAKTIYHILKALKSRNLKAIFYVNVYEHLQYEDNILEIICKDIAKDGHELALHAHKSNSLGFYKKDLIECTYKEQYKIIKYGKELLEKWTGQEVINFRAGGYAHNSDTLKILEELGFEIDSSYFYKRSFLPEHSNKYILPYKIGKLIEVPILYIPLIHHSGKIDDRKFDINSLTFGELCSVVKHGKTVLPCFSYMMHSFSFIKRKRIKEKEFIDESKLLLKSPLLNSKGHYIGVVELNNKLFDDFCLFLDFLKEEKDLEVVTMRNSLNELRKIVDKNIEEVVPLLYK